MKLQLLEILLKVTNCCAAQSCNFDGQL